MPRPLGRLLALDVPLAVLVGAAAVGTARFTGVVGAGRPMGAGSYDGPHDGPYGGGPPWWDGAPLTPLSWWLLPVVVVLVAAIAGRRWRPRIAFGLAAAAAAGYLGLGYLHGPVVVGLVLTGFALAGRLSPRRWWPWSLLAVPALAVALPASGSSVLDPGPWGSLVSSLTVVGLAFAVGAALRSRRQALRVERELDARRYAYQERLRIAADVHDIVGHSLSVITVQAGVALHVLSRRPDQAEESLRAIRTTSTDALTELRATLDTFRDPDFDQLDIGPLDRGRAGTGTEPRTPQPGLDRLDDLVSSLAAAGSRVQVVRRQEGLDDGADPWPAALDQAAYRIVQESLTNVVRHAAGSDARVDILSRPGHATLTISDHGPGPGSRPGAGHGIAGMRERARSLGGSLDTGPGPEGGFVVVAELPVPRSTATGEPRP